MRRKTRYSFVPSSKGRGNADPPGARTLSVGELTRGIRHLLEGAYPRLAVRGEVGGMSAPRSGHLYFTLHDEGDAVEAQIAVVIWRDDALRLRFRLEDGMRVVVRGRISVYEPRGTYQVIADAIETAGAGDLALALERLRGRLAAEGLFDAARKRPLPFLPRRIGIVTSPTGAALQDILKSLFRRHPEADVRVFPARVQGAGSAEDVARGIEFLGGNEGGVDVVIVTRGGGSPEDLWTFNEERVVRAVAACPVPTISAVGHEIDFTLCDFAADVRAQTPTHAGEIVVPDMVRLRLLLEEDRARLSSALRRSVERAAERLRSSSAVFLTRSRADVIEARIRRVDELAKDLRKNLYSTYERWQDRLLAFSARLDGLNPLGVLRRGYSVVFDSRGKAVRKAEGLLTGEMVRILFEKGGARATIQEVEGNHGG
jgi:exodeoxyribonuclease VII large subunit